MTTVKRYLSSIGKKGGRVRSAKKTTAVRRNAAMARSARVLASWTEHELRVVFGFTKRNGGRQIDLPTAEDIRMHFIPSHSAASIKMASANFTGELASASRLVQKILAEEHTCRGYGPSPLQKGK